MIRVTIKDKEALQEITIDDFKTYLTNKGWYKKDDYNKMFNDGSKSKVAELWAPGKGSMTSVAVIVVPMSETLADYTARMAENMIALERSEGRSQLEIYVDITKTAIIIEPTKAKKVKSEDDVDDEKPVVSKKKAAPKKRQRR